MSTSTVRPTSTVSNGTSSIGGGAGSREAAVSDDSDSTYVDVSGAWPSTTTNFAFTLPALDPDDIVLGATLRAKLRSSTGIVGMGVSLSTGGSLASTAVILNTTAATVALLDASGDGSTLEAGFWRTAGSGAARLLEAYLDIKYLAAPTVSVTSPTGTLTEDNAPTIEWDTTVDEDSLGQVDWEVKVFTSAVYGAGGFDPETSTVYATASPAHGETADTSASVGTLGNNTFRAYVRVTQLGPSGQRQTSDWAYTQFTVNVSPPDAPAVVYTDDPANGRVSVAITPDNSPVATDGVTLQKLIDGEWVELAYDTTGSPVTLYDYEAQPGVLASYRVLGWNDTATARLYTTAVTGSVTPAGQRWWLKHPTDPTLNVELSTSTNPVRSLPGHSRASRTAIHQPIGREDAVAVFDTPGAKAGTLVFMVQDFDDQEAVEEILGAGVPLLLSGPFDNHWVDKWIAPLDQDWARIVDFAYTEPVDVTINWQQVERP